MASPSKSVRRALASRLAANSMFLRSIVGPFSEADHKDRTSPTSNGTRPLTLVTTATRSGLLGHDPLDFEVEHGLDVVVDALEDLITVLVELGRPVGGRCDPAELDGHGDQFERDAGGIDGLFHVAVCHNLGVAYDLEAVLCDRPLPGEALQAVAPVCQGRRRENSGQDLAGGTGVGGQELVRGESLVGNEVLTFDGPAGPRPVVKTLETGEARNRPSWVW